MFSPVNACATCFQNKRFVDAIAFSDVKMSRLEVILFTMHPFYERRENH